MTTAATTADPFRYEIVPDWCRPPGEWDFGEVAAVAVDDRDRVYAFNRGEHPMMVFDRDGNFIASWGEKVFSRAHGLHFAHDGMLYCTDMGDHTVRKCTPEGKVLLTLGIPGNPQPFMSGKPFCRCTHSAIARDGEIFVSDGYGNAAVHRFSPDGKYIASWGECGSDPGQFNLPHNIWCDADDWIYVADRENHRVQVFDRRGRYETQWNNLHRPMAMARIGGACPCCVIAEAGPDLPVNRDYPNLGPRLSFTDGTGRVLARLNGSRSDPGSGSFIAPHGIAADSQGNLYVADVARAAWPSAFPGVPVPERLTTLYKLVRIAEPR
jgi:DNA-binding beta-propeller fold protein YncE